MDVREIALLEERRQAQAFAELCPVAAEVAGGVMTYLEPGAWSNSACALGLDGPVEHGEVERVIEFYESRGCEPFVEVSPYADPSLLEHLRDTGFVLYEFESVWCRATARDQDARSLTGETWPTDDQGRPLEIRRASGTSERDMRFACDVGMATFFSEPRAVTPQEAEQQRAIIEHPRGDTYIGAFGEQDVAVCGMESAPPIASLFAMVTVPEHRRRGVQMAMIAHRLVRAGERRCDWALIHCNPGMTTERNAQRLGFSLAYTKANLIRPGHGLVSSR